MTIAIGALVIAILAGAGLFLLLRSKSDASNRSKGRPLGTASARPSGVPVARASARPTVQSAAGPTAGAAQQTRTAAATAGTASTAAPAAAPTTPAVASGGELGVPPIELAGFALPRHEDLSPERRAALVAELSSIPRPPVSLHKLVSPSFLEHAGSVELSELVMGEALIAAKVLGTVNSPLYGLRQPVLSLGQAMVFLGLNTVRAICLRYLLDESFKANSPELRHRYDAILKASAIASELGARLSQKLELPQPGVLVTQIVLAYIGQFATASLRHQQGDDTPPPTDLLCRARDEQQRFGLAAAEIGGLLMQIWGLPLGIVDEVRSIDRLLVAPAAAREQQGGFVQALCYLCTRLGDRLASGVLTELERFDLAADTGSELFYLHASLTAQQETRLTDALRLPEVLNAVQQLTSAPR